MWYPSHWYCIDLGFLDYVPGDVHVSPTRLLCFNHMIVNNVRKVLELRAGSRLDRSEFWIAESMRTLRTPDGKDLTDKHLTFCL